jgi:FlaA1/EpsC-like NDP-sugar epimerase
MSPSVTTELPARVTSCIKENLDISSVGDSLDSSKHSAIETEAAPLNSSAEHNRLETGKLQPSRVRQRRTLESFSLEGKVCVVTGGASGIGLEICRAILESGGQVAIIDLSSTHKPPFLERET